MVDIAQLVEPWIVVPVVAGSTPVVHPMFTKSILEGVYKPGEGGLFLSIKIRPRRVLQAAFGADKENPPPRGWAAGFFAEMV